MARQRDYKAEYARRQERARARGFANYYAERIRGGATAAPDAPAPRGPELRKARGHAGAKDLLREFEPGSSIAVSTNLRNISTDDRGNFESIPVTVTTSDGEEIEYILRDFSDDDLDYLIDELEDMDADFESGGYDLRALVGR